MRAQQARAAAMLRRGPALTGTVPASLYGWHDAKVGTGGAMVAGHGRRARAASRLLAGALCAALCAGISACAVGPNFVAPEDPPVTRYTREPLKNPSAADAITTRQGGSADQSFVSGADIPGNGGSCSARRR